MNKESGPAWIANNSHLREIDLFYIAMTELEKKHGRSSMLKAGMADAFIACLRISGYEVATDKLYNMLYVTGKPMDVKAVNFKPELLEAKVKLLEAAISEANEVIAELKKRLLEG